ncbi:MAG TPA: phosphoribosylanthranilate isomerase [Candidatus Humimicrobiaceae bacterium]|nr:phosphoribosylanthranilate isomerase [Candidatus Humimicrobiaceae bacterium]
MVWIKICGITSLEDATGISYLGVDAIGFVLSTNSPRRVKPETAKEIITVLRGSGIKVPAAGVFVNEKIERVIQCSNLLGLDYIQLSGDEDDDYIKNLREGSGKIKIIKALRIKNKNKDKKDMIDEIDEKIDKLKDYADFILLDSYRKGIYGGTGVLLDWEMLKNYCSKIPVILSGGLDPENVKRAVNTVGPFGVDASSGLEIYPGKKDLNKVAGFVNVLR